MQDFIQRSLTPQKLHRSPRAPRHNYLTALKKFSAATRLPALLLDRRIFRGYRGVLFPAKDYFFPCSNMARNSA